ncbi:MAG TPA: hypothetical protein VMS22_26255 [Candidatus Eisenbacteria bacterium]|nr:hypothetical protein [Candidatus Eisenbacteria bacterium]
MRRVVGIVVSYLVGLGVATWWITATWGDTAYAKGQDLYPHRVLAGWLAKWEGEHLDVVWLGDSTLMELTMPSYPSVIQRKDLNPLRMRSANLCTPGFDFFGYYTLIGPVLDLRPRVVVLVAHLRLFDPGGTNRGFTDLAGLIPGDELPRAVTLPIAARGLTAPRLLLARLIDTDWGVWTFLVAEGLRNDFQEAGFWSALGTSKRPRLGPAMAGIAGRYAAALTPGHPLVRFAGETVRMATARGVPALVVVTPIPWEWLTARGTYDPAAVAAHVEVLRRVVEANGGTLLDLHDALTKPEFRDLGGHFSAQGADKMAALVWPALQPLLLRSAGLSAPAASRGTP